MLLPKQLLLVMPPQLGLLSGFSTGLISLANYVRLSKLDEVVTDILDLSAVSADRIGGSISQSLKTQCSHIIGITSTTASYQSALATARAFKRLDPKCTIILGGHHASADTEIVLQKHRGLIDYIVSGEGEKAIVEFVYKFPDVYAVPGLAFLRNDEVIQNPRPPFLTRDELDRIPMLVQENGLHKAPGKFEHVTYVSARGCPLLCSFCSVSGEPIRTKSMQRVIADIKELVDLGYSKVAIEDNFFAHSLSRTRELCHALAQLKESGVRFGWDCQTRVESLANDDTIALLDSAGCEAVYIGVESLNADQLLYLNKTVDTERYLKLLINKVVPGLLKSGVNCYLNLQFGLPHENTSHHEATSDILRTLGAEAERENKYITLFPQLHVVYPGTRHFHSGVKDRRYASTVFESFTEWEAQQAPVLNWLGEHFAHGTGGLPEGILNAKKLNRERYEVDADAVLRVSNILTTLGRIPGIKVFKYGTYLVAH